MPDSLRKNLKQALEDKYPNYLTLDEIEVICHRLKKKLSNAERRFRFDKKAPHLYIPTEKKWNEKGNAIIGYKWIPFKKEIADKKVIPPLEYHKPAQIAMFGGQPYIGR